jgi:hypothetical protein
VTPRERRFVDSFQRIISQGKRFFLLVVFYCHGGRNNFLTVYGKNEDFIYYPAPTWPG